MIKTSNSKGIALFITLTLLLLLSVIAVAILLNSYNYASVSEGQIKRARAISLAESGIHYAYWKRRSGEDDNGEEVDFDDGNSHVLHLFSDVIPEDVTTALHPSDIIPEGMTIEVEVSAPDENGRKTIHSRVIY